MAELEYDVTVGEGKYRLTYDKKMAVAAYRHGQPWPAGSSGVLGCGLTLALVQEVAELRAELARRDANENRNCINWGPCSANDGRMGEGPVL